MDYVRLGRTGLKVSKLVLGCMTYGTPTWRPWVLDEEASLPFFRKAIEGGINFFDTADMYSLGQSEVVTGKALAQFAKREDVVIATKVFFPHSKAANAGGLSRKHIFDAIDRSLKNLGTDHVDLYQIHRFDPATPIEETMEALHDVVKAGKARYLGASSMYAWQFARMQSVAELNGWTKFASMQPQYNLVYREEEREMLPFCLSEGVGVIPWSPLARGFLAGGRARPGEGETERSRTDEFSPHLYYREADHAVVEAVSQVAAARGVSNTQVALAWVLRNPAITAPIVGASKLHHLDEALAAIALELTEAEVKTLEAPYRPKPVLDHQ
ncbi:aldo/keto reductase [Caulobacter ginsengisoli]|nr:aldo/keto reductase [Caulobacter ginsengisoli]